MNALFYILRLFIFASLVLALAITLVFIIPLYLIQQATFFIRHSFSEGGKLSTLNF